MIMRSIPEVPSKIVNSGSTRPAVTARARGMRSPPAVGGPAAQCCQAASRYPGLAPTSEGSPMARLVHQLRSQVGSASVTHSTRKVPSGLRSTPRMSSAKPGALPVEFLQCQQVFDSRSVRYARGRAGELRMGLSHLPGNKELDRRRWHCEQCLDGPASPQPGRPSSRRRQDRTRQLQLGGEP